MRSLLAIVCFAAAVSATVYPFPWRIPASPGDYYDRTFLTGDIVNFTWTGNHNVYLFLNEAHFNACNFTGATLLANVGPYALNTTAGTHYIGCSIGSHCVQNQKVKFTVSDTASCDTYCTTMSEACIGSNAQYAGAYSGFDQCLDFCRYGLSPFRAATPTTYNTKDTFECYYYHATVAVSVPDVHCAHAGPTGGLSVCSALNNSICRPFCRESMTACSSNYDNQAACETACLAQDAMTPFAPGTTSGDSSDCRFYHLTVAASLYFTNDTAGAALHCGHASATGNDVCASDSDSGASSVHVSLAVISFIALAVSKIL